MFNDLFFRLRALFRRDTVEIRSGRGAALSLRSASREVHQVWLYARRSAAAASGSS